MGVADALMLAWHQAINSRHADFVLIWSQLIFPKYNDDPIQ